MTPTTDIWTTKDGRQLKVKDMEDSHLVNTIAFIQRNCELQRMKLSLFYVLCPEPSGDMAQVCFEREQQNIWDATWETYAPEIYHIMVAEALDRNLELKPEVDYKVQEVNMLTHAVTKNNQSSKRKEVPHEP